MTEDGDVTVWKTAVWMLPSSWSFGDFVLLLRSRDGLLSALVEVLWLSLRPLVTLPANLIACGTHASSGCYHCQTTPGIWFARIFVERGWDRLLRVLHVNGPAFASWGPLFVACTCTDVRLHGWPASFCDIVWTVILHREYVMACVIAFFFNRSWTSTARYLTEVTVSFLHFDSLAVGCVLRGVIVELFCNLDGCFVACTQKKKKKMKENLRHHDSRSYYKNCDAL